MSMFCNQCQEAAKSIGCSIKGVCGKDDRTSNFMDLLVYVLQGMSVNFERLQGNIERKYGIFLAEALFCSRGLRLCGDIY